SSAPWQCRRRAGRPSGEWPLGPWHPDRGRRHRREYLPPGCPHRRCVSPCPADCAGPRPSAPGRAHRKARPRPPASPPSHPTLPRPQIDEEIPLAAALGETTQLVLDVLRHLSSEPRHSEIALITLARWAVAIGAIFYLAGDAPRPHWDATPGMGRLGIDASRG